MHLNLFQNYFYILILSKLNALEGFNLDHFFFSHTSPGEYLINIFGLKND